MKKGFTLVELIVVISIMSIFGGVGFTVYTRNIQTKELDRQVDAFVNVLSLTRNKAISRDITPNAACTRFDRYDVLVWQTSSPPQYRVRFVCTTPASSLDVGSTYSMSPNMTVTGLPASPSDIQFHHPYGCTTDACNAVTPTTIVIRNTSNARCKDVIINRLGSITVGDQYGC